MTGFIVSVFPFRNRVSPKEAFEVLELGEGKLSRPVLKGPGGRKAAWPLGHQVPFAQPGCKIHPLRLYLAGNALPRVTKLAFFGLHRAYSHVCLP